MLDIKDLLSGCLCVAVLADLLVVKSNTHESNNRCVEVASQKLIHVCEGCETYKDKSQNDDQNHDLLEHCENHQGLGQPLLSEGREKLMPNDSV